MFPPSFFSSSSPFLTACVLVDRPPYEQTPYPGVIERHAHPGRIQACVPCSIFLTWSFGAYAWVLVWFLLIWFCLLGMYHPSYPHPLTTSYSPPSASLLGLWTPYHTSVALPLSPFRPPSFVPYSAYTRSRRVASCLFPTGVCRNSVAPFIIMVSDLMDAPFGTDSRLCDYLL